MVDFRAVIENLQDIHFYDVFLPFILIYAVVLAVLEKSKIFSTNEENSNIKNVNSVIAFVFGLFVVASIQTVIYIQELIVGISLVIIFILVVLILLGFIFGEEYSKLFKDTDGNVKGWVSWSIGIIVFLVALSILFNILGVWEFIFSFFNNTDSGDFWNFVIIIVVILILVWITKDNSKKNNKKP